MTIKHLVLSGGGPSGFLLYGSARYLSQKGFWNISNIRTIYGCSIGAFIGIILSLNYEWELLDDYFIKRPWNKVIDTTINKFVDIYSKCGLISDKFIIESIKSLFTAKDLNIDTTMKELYDITNIEIHIYSTNLNSEILEKIDISYKTHPELSVITALKMSMAFPIVFEPVYIEDNCYIDGGILNNLPLNDCIEQTNADTNEILVFKNKKINNNNNNNLYTNSTLIDYTHILIQKIQKYVCSEKDQKCIKNTVYCTINEYNINDWFEILSSRDKREKLIEDGSRDGEKFYIESHIN